MTASSRGAERPTRVTAGTVLRLLRTGAARSRADLVALTGAPRRPRGGAAGPRAAPAAPPGAPPPAVSPGGGRRGAAGRGGGGGGGAPGGARPPTLLAFNRAAGHVLAVDLGATSVRVALTDL